MSHVPQKHLPTIEKATTLFWRAGFDGVSIDDVVKVTGVNRYAIYQTFGGKKGLFTAALDAYCAQGKQLTLELLKAPGLPAFEAIRQSIAAKMANEDMFAAGCLMTTTAVEVASKDPDIAEQLFQHIGTMKGIMEAALSRAQAEGDLAPDANISAISEIVFNLFVGVGVQARLGVPREQLAKNIDAAFCALKYEKRT